MDDKEFGTDAYMHYLHHKYFNVNYGGGGLVLFDKFLGHTTIDPKIPTIDLNLRLN